MSSHKPRSGLNGPIGYLGAIGLTLVAGVFGALGSDYFGDWPGMTGLLLTLLVNTAALGAAVLVGIWWWRGIDEAAREAHKWAWWWGGSSGMLVGAILLLTALNRPAEAELGGLDMNQIFAGGMVVVLLCQVIGYGIAWAVWWAQRR
ncbi:hypothetical protein GCM10009422_29510 [Brevundimonas kwangchunensis]|uniref:Uncharacterized protein n=1 Tax=Brevundimonas kwangchunensis TaxID=322163 RepID=A0ABN1H6A7_9CAUL